MLRSARLGNESMSSLLMYLSDWAKYSGISCWDMNVPRINFLIIARNEIMMQKRECLIQTDFGYQEETGVRVRCSLIQTIQQCRGSWNARSTDLNGHSNSGKNVLRPTVIALSRYADRIMLVLYITLGLNLIYSLLTAIHFMEQPSPCTGC